MKITIEFGVDGAAFEDDFESEIHAVLVQAERKICAQLRREPATVCTVPEAVDKLFDTNGNTVGIVKI